MSVENIGTGPIIVPGKLRDPAMYFVQAADGFVSQLQMHEEPIAFSSTPSRRFFC